MYYLIIPQNNTLFNHLEAKAKRQHIVAVCVFSEGIFRLSLLSLLFIENKQYKHKDKRENSSRKQACFEVTA